MKRFLVCVLLSLALLVSCRRPRGSDRGPSGAANPPVQGDVPIDAYEDQSQGGNYGGTLVMALPSNPRSFNPITAIDSSTIWVTQGLLYRSLVDYDNSEQHVVPGLATSWETSASGLEWSFQLRRGVNWSDGEPFTASDVLFNIELVFDPKTGSPSRSLFVQSDGSLPAYGSDGDYAVRFHLLEPNAEFLIALGSIYLIPKHKWEGAYRRQDITRALTIGADPQDMVGL